MPRLTTEWSTDDPTVAELLVWLMSLPEFSVERHEALAGLHMLQARWEWARADRARAHEVDAARRKARREARRATKDA